MTQRTREIGLRMALGARAGQVLRQVKQYGLRYVLAGMVVGALGALSLTRYMGSLFFGIPAADPGTYVLVTLTLSLVALLACWLSARRATRIDPMAALRHD